MTSPKRIDFYVLNRHLPDGKLRFACRLTEKAYKLGHTVYVQVESTEQSGKMDDLLWTFSQSSFIPHTRVDTLTPASAEDYPVIIGDTAPPQWMNGLLVSLCEQVSPYSSQFERVAEVIDASNDSKANGRARYRAYQDQGHKPETHQVKV